MIFKNHLSYIQANDSLTGSNFIRILWKPLMKTMMESSITMKWDEKGVETTQFSNLATALDIQ